jgi:beta-lactamase superfamily II metal-dependent hydrolase
MLRSLGVPRIDILMVSHQYSDHSGGSLSLLDTVAVTSLLSSLPLDHPIVSAREARLELCKNSGQRMMACTGRRGPNS